jgi:hypothetical protein
LADEPSLVGWVKQRVTAGIIAPLAEKEPRRFARVRPPPRERRVRALQTTAAFDRSGRPFVPFAIDVRFGSDEWQKDDIVGCVYRESGNLFVKKGDAYRPAEFLLGKDAAPVAGVCETAPQRS